MRFYLTIILATLWSVFIHAQSDSIMTLSVNIEAPDTVVHGEHFNVSYVVSGMEWDEYKHPQFDGYTLHSIKSNIVYEKTGNTRRMKYFKFHYELSASRLGNLMLPDIGNTAEGMKSDVKGSLMAPQQDKKIFVGINEQYAKELSGLYNLLADSGIKSETFGLTLAVRTDELLVFNGEGGKSFFMVATNEYSECLDNTLLAYSHEREISSWETEKFIDLIGIYRRQLRHLKSSGMKYERQPILSYAPKKERVNPLLGKTAWGQSAPYNKFCPESEGGADGGRMVGCVPVALAQVMRYYAHPAKTEGRYAYEAKSGTLYEMDFSNQTIEWGRIQDSYASAEEREEVIAPIAGLMAMAGVSVGADFGDEMTGANFGRLKMALVNFFGYSPACTEVRAYTEFEHEGEVKRAKEVSADAFLGLTLRELDEKRPVIVSDFAHAFVCDGYEEDYLHFNLGWNGSCNGYYRMLMIPDYHDFPLIYKSMLIGIRPDDESHLNFSRTVVMDSVSSLSELLSDEEKRNLHSLTIDGEIDGRDMKLIRQMSGATEMGDYFAWRGSLRHLDLSRATFSTATDADSAYFTVNARDIGFSINGSFQTVHKSGTKDELQEVSRTTEHVRYDFINLSPEQWEDICERNLTHGKGYHLTEDSGKYYVNYLMTKGEVGTKMFEGCDNLATIKLPEETTKIGRYAFLDCHLLKVVELPKGVEKIEKSAFGNTYLLEKVLSHKTFDYDFGDDTFIDNKGFVLPE